MTVLFRTNRKWLKNELRISIFFFGQDLEFLFFETYCKDFEVEIGKIDFALFLVPSTPVGIAEDASFDSLLLLKDGRSISRTWGMTSRYFSWTGPLPFFRNFSFLSLSCSKTPTNHKNEVNSSDIQ